MKRIAANALLAVAIGLVGAVVLTTWPLEPDPNPHSVEVSK